MSVSQVCAIINGLYFQRRQWGIFGAGTGYHDLGRSLKKKRSLLWNQPSHRTKPGTTRRRSHTRYRRELIDFPDSNHFPPIEIALPDQVARSQLRYEIEIATMKKRLSPRYQVWVEARLKFRLSHAHIQMARELGLNPKKLGGLANHDQERWKSPLPRFIEDLYRKRFGSARPEVVMTIEQMAQQKRKACPPQQESTQVESEDDPGGDPF